jgi:hypothetical protein
MTMLSCRMIRLLPLTPPVSKLPLFLSFLVCRQTSLLTGAGVGEEPNHTIARKPGPLQIIQYSLLLPFVLTLA